MYEDTYLETANAAVQFEHDVHHPSVGNLQRLHRPVERWESMLEKTLPPANYWHAKNYLPTEAAQSQTVVTAPALLSS